MKEKIKKDTLETISRPKIEGFEYDKKRREFPWNLSYKDRGYLLHKDNKDGTAFYLCTTKSRALREDQPASIQVDKEGNVIWEDL